MVGVDGSDDDTDLRSRGGGVKREGPGGSDIKNPNQRGIEPGKLGGEEARGDRGAEEWAAAPLRGEAPGVVGVEVGEEVRLALLAPPIDRDQALLHG